MHTARFNIFIPVFLIYESCILYKFFLFICRCGAAVARKVHNQAEGPSNPGRRVIRLKISHITTTSCADGGSLSDWITTNNAHHRVCSSNDYIRNSEIDSYLRFKGGGEPCDSHFSPVLSSLHSHIQAKGPNPATIAF